MPRKKAMPRNLKELNITDVSVPVTDEKKRQRSCKSIYRKTDESLTRPNKDRVNAKQLGLEGSRPTRSRNVTKGYASQSDCVRRAFNKTKRGKVSAVQNETDTTQLKADDGDQTNRQEAATPHRAAITLDTTSSSVEAHLELELGVSHNAKSMGTVQNIKGKRQKEAKLNSYSQESAKQVEETPLFKSLTCPYCEFEYRCPKVLAPHVQATHPTQLLTKTGTRSKYKCLYCEESSTRPRNVVSHMHIIHSEHFSMEALRRKQKFRCGVEGCSHSFRREAKLRRHMRLLHGEKNRVRQCPRYDIEKLRERAEKMEKGEKSIWGRGSSNKEAKHSAASIRTVKHKSSRLKDCHEDCWRIAQEDKGFSCFHCDKTFTYHCQCVIHELRHEVKQDRSHAQGDISEHCSDNEEMVNIKKLADDGDNVKIGEPAGDGNSGNSHGHSTGAGNNDAEKAPYKKEMHYNETMEGEDDDSTTFDVVENGGSHNFPSKGEDGAVLAHVCPLCKKAFTTVRYARVHMDVVHGKNARYVCTDCGKKYIHKKGLTSHLANHHSAAPRPPRLTRYKCDVCEASLATHSGMKTHMDKHNGVRPYSCQHCDRTFTSMNHWKAHESIHTGNKAHRCPVCYKSFTNQGTLYNHLYRYAVHGKLPRVRHYGNGANVEALTIAAAEQLRQMEEMNKKDSEQPQAKTSRKSAPTRSLLIPSNNAAISLTEAVVATGIAHSSSEVPVDTDLASFEEMEPPQTAENVMLSDAIQLMTQDMVDEAGHQVVVRPDLSDLSDHVVPTVPSTQTIEPSQPQMNDVHVMSMSTEGEEGAIAGGPDVDPDMLSGEQVAFLIVQPEGAKERDELGSQEGDVQYIQINMTQGGNIVKYLLPSEIGPIDNMVEYFTKGS